jgi:uncharacterized phage protein (TIGR01671 family)
VKAGKALEKEMASAAKIINIRRKSMQELKFKAWDIKREYMYEEVISIDLFKEGAQIIVGGEDIEYDKSVYREDVILRQYTGLRDKNGKEIYVGDLLATNRGVFQVTFYDQQIEAFNISDDATDHYLEDFNESAGVSLRTKNMEWLIVIGNIYENPELLVA